MTFRNPTIYDCGIYCITSPSGKKYIGSSNNIPKRWNAHKRQLIKGNHHSPYLQHAWNKYQGNFQFSVLLVCREEDLQIYEQQYRACGPHKQPRTEEHKIKLSKAGMGHPVSEETRRKIGEKSREMWARKKAEHLGC